MAAPAKGGPANPASKCNFVAQDQIWYLFSSPLLFSFSVHVLKTQISMIINGQAHMKYLRLLQ